MKETANPLPSLPPPPKKRTTKLWTDLQNWKRNWVDVLKKFDEIFYYINDNK